MVLSHSQNSNICVHVWSGAHNKFIILKANPVRHIFGESHFGIQINTTVVPKSHPSPDVGFESLWSEHLECFVSSLNSNFLHLLRDHLNISIKCLVVEILVLSAIWQEFLRISLKPLWFPRTGSKDQVVDTFAWHFIFILHLLNEGVRNTSPVNCAHICWLMSL